jgi:hypothetical protein
MRRWSMCKAPRLQLILEQTCSSGFRTDDGKVHATFDMFNVTNSGAITAASDLTGPAFQTVSQTLTPRIFRLGVRYEF